MRKKRKNAASGNEGSSTRKEKDVLQLDGVVLESLPNATFTVEVEQKLKEASRKHVLLCHISGKMRRFHIRIMPGDRVRVEVTPYDLSKGRIVYREQ